MKIESIDRTPVECPHCLGDGEFYQDIWYYQGNFHSTITHCCETCSGSGWIYKYEAAELEQFEAQFCDPDSEEF